MWVKFSENECILATQLNQALTHFFNKAPVSLVWSFNLVLILV